VYIYFNKKNKNLVFHYNSIVTGEYETVRFCLIQTAFNVPNNFFNMRMITKYIKKHQHPRKF